MTRVTVSPGSVNILRTSDDTESIVVRDHSAASEHKAGGLVIEICVVAICVVAEDGLEDSNENSTNCSDSPAPKLDGLCAK